MKVIWILYIISCSNCEWEVVNTYKTDLFCQFDCISDKWEEMNSYDTEKDCVREQRRQERMRKGIGYWNDPARFECIEIHELQK